MWWNNPYWLILLAPLGYAVWRGARAGAEARTGRTAADRLLRRLAALRTAAILAVILALAGTSILLPTHRRHLSILLDVSESIGTAEREKARQSADTILARLNPTDRAAVAVFAGQPRILTGLTSPAEARVTLETADLQAPQAKRTDLRAALRVGEDLLKDSRTNRSIILLSDGRANSGGNAPAVFHSIPIHTVPIGKPESGLVAKGLDLPETAPAGEQIVAKWHTSTDRPRRVRVAVRVDGKVTREENLDLAAGQNTSPVTIEALASGVHQVEITALGEDGGLLPDAAIGALLKVSGLPRILVLNGNTGHSPITRALRIQGMAAVDLRPADLPDTVGGLGGYAAVVLDNVPAPYLSAKQQAALEEYVADGGGLLVAGGDSSLGRGEYYDSRLEDLLPVQTDTRQRLRFTRANILFVVDHSGSMTETVGGMSKQKAVMQGVAAALNELNPQDEVGVLAFDTAATWLVPFTVATKKAEILRGLEKMPEGGGTDMSTALVEAARGLSGLGPVRKLVVIMTDGLTLAGNEGFDILSKRLKSIGATLTTIGVGTEINEALLRDIAKWGQGKFYRANLDQVPVVIRKETIRVTRDLIQEGSFRPAVNVAADLLSGLDTGMPPVLGYLLTKPKKLATVYLNIGKADPLLASWRYGNGIVSVFTSDSGSRWLAPWSGSTYYNLLWSQTVRSLERSALDTGLRLSARVEAGVVKVVAEAIDANRYLRTGLRLTGNMGGQGFSFSETSPGRYEAVFPLSGQGLREFEVRDRLSNDWTIGSVWIPPGGEALKLGPDLAALGQLSMASVGRILSAEQPALPRTGLAWEPFSLRMWLLLAALVLLIVELCYRSTSLGQAAMARAALTAWRATQARLWQQVRGPWRSGGGAAAGSPANAAVDARRYLAERLRKNREEK